jgi:hypothetical protein
LVLHRTVSCPLCRNTIFDCTPPIVVFQPELDERISHFVLQKNKKHKKYGIGFIQRDDRVIVSSVEKYLKNIKTNQFVVGINNLPCYNKKCLIEILAKKEKSDIYLSTI